MRADVDVACNVSGGGLGDRGIRMAARSSPLLREYSG